MSKPLTHTLDVADSAARGEPLFLYSDLWVDAPNAVDAIEQQLGDGFIDQTEAHRLEELVQSGFLRFSLSASKHATIDQLLEDVEQLWHASPHDVAYAYDSPAKRMSRANVENERRPRYRLHDIHSHSEASLDLYLDDEIFQTVELIYGEPAVAIQSLFFEYGSQQEMHRDPVVVPTAPASHLLAAWIALEDIHPDCGPLQVVPGSHRLPYYEFAPGEFMYDASRMGAEDVERALAWDRAQCAHAGLSTEPYLANKGDVLVWHHSLLHGGAAPVNPQLTRRSLVVHFSTLRHYLERGITLEEIDSTSGTPGSVIYRTRDKVSRQGRQGFANPVANTG